MITFLIVFKKLCTPGTFLVTGFVNGWRQRNKNADLWMFDGECGSRLSEEVRENVPAQRFWRPSCSELTKTSRLWLEVVSVKRSEPEKPSCYESDLAILLGHIKVWIRPADIMQLSFFILHLSSLELLNLHLYKHSHSDQDAAKG